MKEDNYSAERSDRFELVSIEQANDERYSATENGKFACSVVDSGPTGLRQV